MPAKQFGTILSIALLIGGLTISAYGLVKNDGSTVIIAFAAPNALPEEVDDIYLTIPEATLVTHDGTPHPITLSPEPISLRSLSADAGIVLAKETLPVADFHSLVLHIEGIRVAMTNGSALRTITPGNEFILPIEAPLHTSDSILIKASVNTEESFFVSDTGAWIALPSLRIETTADASVSGNPGEHFSVIKGTVVESEAYESDTDGVMIRNFEVPDGYLLSVEGGEIILKKQEVEVVREPLPSIFTPTPIYDGSPQPI